MHMTAVSSYRTCIYSYAYEVAIQKKAFLGSLVYDLNTDSKRRLFNFCKCTEVVKEGIISGLFSAAYPNGDHYYDVGPLCPILRDENEEMKKQLKNCVNWRGRRSRPSGGRVCEGDQPLSDDRSLSNLTLKMVHSGGFENVNL